MDSPLEMLKKTAETAAHPLVVFGGPLLFLLLRQIAFSEDVSYAAWEHYNELIDPLDADSAEAQKLIHEQDSLELTMLNRSGYRLDNPAHLAKGFLPMIALRALFRPKSGYW